MSKNIIIIGTQWGDEGKGKIIDLISKNMKYVVRYQGGNNAGHTLYIKNKKIVLHLIPSGILQKKVTAILASGVVICTDSLIQEINNLKKENININKRLFISQNCHLIMDYHIALDKAREKKLGIKAIGTTQRGIGPAYEDKVSRRGIRINDVFKKNFSFNLKENTDYYNFQLVNFYQENPIDYKKIYTKIINNVFSLKEKITNISELFYSIKNTNKMILFEGAQGALLDIDHGTYPFVTSSNTNAGYALTSAGIGLYQLPKVIGVLKAYSTRVGNGPFPTELFCKIGDFLSYKGNEFGATTGRKRRVGWLDIVSIKMSIELNSISSLCLTKLDILDELSEIKICIAYRNKRNKKIIRKIFFSFEDLEKDELEPVYENIPGWKKNTYGINDASLLPKEAIYYISRIESLTGIPINIISTGPERTSSIIIGDFYHKII